MENPIVQPSARAFVFIHKRPDGRRSDKRGRVSHSQPWMDGSKSCACWNADAGTLERWNVLLRPPRPGRAARRLASLLPKLLPKLHNPLISGLNPTRRSHLPTVIRHPCPLSITSTASHNRFRVTTLNRSTPINTFLTTACIFQRACLGLPLS